MSTYDMTRKFGQGSALNTILDEYVTVPEAARLVQVSPSTIWRWIDRGLLPAYRIGRRRVRLKRSDLPKVVAPARSTRSPAGNSGPAWSPPREPLTELEREQMLAAVEGSRRLFEEQLRQRGGKVFPSSADLLKEARGERLSSFA